MNEEKRRLEEARSKQIPWRKWGPYLSERQWGTVREDYSNNGDAWNYFSHDQARSRAYRWGEDGLAGFSDDHSHLCFALALWNGQDPILKERAFGLTNSEGNHGEDVKEYYFYLDSTPTHSYLKYLYKYPQKAFPYTALAETNRSRNRYEFEYELLDTGVFDDNRYYDVMVEYAKASPEDILIQITVTNRGPEAARLNVLPTLWFRNDWEFFPSRPKPELHQVDGPAGTSTIVARQADVGEYYFYAEGQPPLLFTENETNNARLFGAPNRTAFVKDGINNYIVNQQKDAVNPARNGTKTAADYEMELGAGQTRRIRLRLKAAPGSSRPFSDFDEVLDARCKEADEFYQSITPEHISADEANVMRQALAGMLWSKQYYYFDVDQWLVEHDAHPLLGGQRVDLRDRQWFHMINDDVISMPDKWEYPWYAAWDLAFHCITLSAVDIDFAKQQLEIMLRAFYLNPSGQIPAYEWNFSDVNPPVHAWATWFVYQLERGQRGEGDLVFLKGAFDKLLLNFSWWVNRKDPAGKNVFEGGFLGLDNIGVFDRSAQLPTGGHLEQADGTAWMSLFAQNMLSIALELAKEDPTYEDVALKFVEHFMWIGAAMNRIGDNQDEMWDETDGFFYDLLRFPDGKATRLHVRSMVGLLPLCAVTVIEKETRQRYPRLIESVRQIGGKHPELLANMAPVDRPGVADRTLLSLLNEKNLRRVLARMLDPNEFLSPYGIRALSRYHADHPYTFRVNGNEFRVDYLPAESNTGMFGGNSNWRGPIWMPVNVLIIRALLVLYQYYGDDLTVECPTGSGKMMNLFEVSREISDRLTSIFTRNAQGQRPVYGGAKKFQEDPYWRDHILFYEYFHGDNGAGLGASHQTGWTGVIARLIQIYGEYDAPRFLDSTKSIFERQTQSRARQHA